MDQELTARGGPELGMYGCDRDMFERIWKRVMPEERADCPIAVNGPPVEEEVHTPQAPAADRAGACTAEETPAPPAAPAEGPCAGGELDFTPPADTPAPEPPSCAAAAVPVQGEPAPEAPLSRQSTGDDFPGPDAVPCLGSGSAGHGEQLREDILSALEGWQLYRHLARKVTGGAARALSALASEKHKQARRLAAAYFLISGVRYWPTDRLETPRISSWLGTLRRRFAEEQQMDSRWRAASLDTEDACLANLYGELAEGCAAHAGVLRTLLEQAL